MSVDCSWFAEVACLACRTVCSVLCNSTLYVHTYMTPLTGRLDNSVVY